MNDIKKLTALNGTPKSAEIKDKIIPFLLKHSHWKNTKQFTDVVRNCGVDPNSDDEVYYYRDCFGDIRGVSVKAIVNGVVRRHSIVDEYYYIQLEHAFDTVYRAERAAANKVG